MGILLLFRRVSVDCRRPHHAWPSRREAIGSPGAAKEPQRRERQSTASWVFFVGVWIGPDCREEWRWIADTFQLPQTSDSGAGEEVLVGGFCIGTDESDQTVEGKDKRPDQGRQIRSRRLQLGYRSVRLTHFISAF